MVAFGGRRWRWLVAIVVLLVAAVALAPSLLAPWVSARLSHALGAPVRVGWLTWNPLRARVVLHHFSVALAADAPAVVTVRAIAVEADVARLLAGDVTLRALTITDPWMDLRRTAGGDLNLASLLRAPADAAPTPSAGAVRLPVPAASPARSATDVETPTRNLVIEHLRIRGGAIVFRDETTAPTLETSLYLDDVAADDVAVALSRRTRIQLRLASRLEKRPLTLDLEYAADAEDSRLRLQLATTGVSLARTVIYLPLGWRHVSGTLDLTLAYARDVAGGRIRSHALDAAATAYDVAFAEPGATEPTVRAGRARIGAITVDFLRRRTELRDVHVEAFTALVARDAGGLHVPFAGTGAPSDTAWTTVVSDVALGAGEVVLRNVLPGADPELRAPVRRGSVRTRAGGGTSVVLETRTAAGPIDVDVRVGATTPRMRLELHDVALSDLAARLRWPVRFATGAVSGTLDLDLGADVRLGGRLTVPGGRTLPVDPARDDEVIAWKDLTLDIEAMRFDPLRVRLRRVDADWPYVMVHRAEHGVFPVTLLEQRRSEPVALASAEPPGTRSPPTRSLVEAADVALRNGRVEFYDTTLQPPYWTELTSADVTATAVTVTPFTAGRVALSGNVDAISPLVASGTIAATRTEARLTVERLRLVPLNAYVAPLIGYTLTSGTARIDANVTVDGTHVDATSDLVLSRLGVAPAGDDPLRGDLGAPLSVAVALMKDSRGDVHLELPIRGDLREGRWETGDLTATAVRKTLVGALRAPVTLLGSIFQGGRDEEERFDLEPMPFAPGRADLRDDARARVRELARLLRRHAELDAVLLPAATAADAAALARGEAEPPITELSALADARLHAVVDELVGREGIDRARVGYVAWTEETPAPSERSPKADTVPGVDVQLRAR